MALPWTDRDSEEQVGEDTDNGSSVQDRVADDSDGCATDDLTDEEREANELAKAHMVASLVNMMDQETELPPATQDEVAGELDYQPDEPAPENDACPRCGSTMVAEADPDTLLDFPMKYLWKCGCGHQETREDDFEFAEEGLPEKA